MGRAIQLESELPQVTYRLGIKYVVIPHRTTWLGSTKSVMNKRTFYIVNLVPATILVSLSTFAFFDRIRVRKAEEAMELAIKEGQPMGGRFVANGNRSTPIFATLP